LQYSGNPVIRQVELLHGRSGFEMPAQAITNPSQLGGDIAGDIDVGDHLCQDRVDFLEARRSPSQTADVTGLYEQSVSGAEMPVEVCQIRDRSHVALLRGLSAEECVSLTPLGRKEQAFS
jgi:hypothetical protein